MARVKKSGEVTGVRATGRQSRVPPPSPAAEPAKTPSSASRTTSSRADHSPRRPAGAAASAAKNGASKKAAKAVVAGRSSSAATTAVRRGEGKPKAGQRKGGGAGRGKQHPGRKPVPPREPLISYRVRVLDPLEKCGPGTSVQQLFRVDESVDGARRAHLVFFDRHGWYCEHGRNCPAVVHAKRTGKPSASRFGRH